MALSFLVNIWWLLVLIGVMILVHELGHFWAARAFDVKVEVFSFGFGPRLFGFRRGETDYRFSLFLFGGYVKMAGEQPGENFDARSWVRLARRSVARSEQIRNDPRAMFNKPRWQRLIILAAGPFMNVVLAIAVLTGLFMVSYEKILNQGGAVVGHVVPDSPAAKAGIQVGDKIVRLDGKDNPDWEEIVTKEIESAQRPLTVTLERAGHRFPITLTPVLDEKEGVGSAGWEGQNEIQVGSRQSRVSRRERRSEEGRSARQDQRYSHPLALHAARSDPQERRKAGYDRIRSRRRSPYDRRSSRSYKNPDGTARWMIGVQTDMKLDIQKTQAFVSRCAS